MRLRFVFRRVRASEKWREYPLYADLSDGRAVREMARTSVTMPAELWDLAGQRVRTRVPYDEDARTDLIDRISTLRNGIEKAWIRDEAAGRTTRGWLARTVKAVEEQHAGDGGTDDRVIHGALFDRFLADRKIGEARKKQYNVLRHILQRYELYLRKASRRLKGGLTPSFFTTGELEHLHDYIRNEHDIYSENEPLFAGSGFQQPKPRGENFVSGEMKKFHTLITYCIKEEKILAEDPFDKYHIQPEIYGTPYFLTKEELDHLFRFDFGRRRHLARVRDLFVFQCMTGPRVADMWRFTEDNVSDGCLNYIPDKSLRSMDSAKVVTVPLNTQALEIIERYRDEERSGYDRRGKLLPLISQIKYNEYIKEMLRAAGIVRTVTTYDSRSGREVERRICDVAASHMARRTFVGNLYEKVADPNLIASMSGHCENSQSFSRYRKISKKQKEDLVRLLEI